MKLYDVDGRLIALDDEATKGFAWQDGPKQWAAISSDFAGRAWIEGKKLSPAQVVKRFPGAKLDAKALDAIR